MFRSRLSFALLLISLATPALAQDTWNMTEVGRATGGRANATAVNGSYVYVAAGRVLNTLDISDPTAPTLLNSIDTPGGANGLLIDGSILYVAQGTDGIGIYSLFDPSDPSLMVVVPTPEATHVCHRSGSRLYVADGMGGLRIYSISHPAILSYLGSYTEPELAVYDVEVVGNLAYVMGVRFEWDLFFPALKIVDVTNPVAPQHLHTQEYSPQGDRGEVIVDEGVIYLSDGFSRIYVSVYVGPSDLVPLADFAAPGRSMELVGDTLYASGYTGLEAFDVSNLGNVTSLGRITTRSWAEEFAVQGDLAVVPVARDGVQLIDISAPATMTEVGHHSAPGWAIGITAHGDEIYVAADELIILDASSLGDLPTLGSFDGSVTSEWAVEFTDDDTAITAGGGVTAIDVSDPTQPTLLSQIFPPGQELDVSVWNKTVYTAQSSEGFAIHDYSDPTSPQLMGNFTQYRVSDLVAGPGFVYAGGSGEIWAIDVSDPALPQITDTTTFTDYIGEMSISQGHLFVCVGTGGVRIFDLSVPSQLNEVGVISAQVRVSSVAVAGNRAYVADDNYLRVYDIASKTNPVQVAYREAVGPVRCVDVLGQIAMVGIADAGIYLFRNDGVTGVTPPGSAFAMSLWPNPVRARANLSFELGWNDDVSLTVYDLAGRRVRQWDRRVVADQPQRLTWGGRDSVGRSVSNGVYLYRLVTSRGQRSGSFVLKR